MDKIVDGVFDVQVDTESEEGTVELEAFRVADGQLGRYTIMDGSTPLAFITVPAEGFSHEGFIETTETDRIAALPAHVQAAYRSVVALASARDGE